MSGFGEAVRREFLKLKRPAVVLTMIAAVAVAVASLVVGATRMASDLDVRASFTRSCDNSLDPVQCKEQLAPALEERLRSQAHQAALRTQAQQTHPLGVGVLVAGHFATAIGWLVVLVVVTAHVGGEYARGSLPWATTLSRRWQLLAAKYVTTLVISLATVVAATLVSAIVVPLLTPSPKGASQVVIGTAVRASAVALGRCCLILAGACAVVLLLAVATKSQLATFATTVLIVGVGLALGEGIGVMPSSLVRDVLDLHPGVRPIPYGYIWRDAAPPGSRLSQTTATVLWTTATALCAVAALVLFDRSDLTGASEG